MPMLRAVPAMILTAASRSAQLRSAFLIPAISSTCLRVTEPTRVRPGSPEPFARLAAFLRRTAAGGLFMMKVKLRSPKMVISTGMMVPSCPWVWALKDLQNSMMLTPCWPRAGPTGGAGLACPPGIWSLMRVRIFLAMRALVDLLHLVEAELDGYLALEDVHEP